MHGEGRCTLWPYVTVRYRTLHRARPRHQVGLPGAADRVAVLLAATKAMALGRTVDCFKVASWCAARHGNQSIIHTTYLGTAQ